MLTQFQPIHAIQPMHPEDIMRSDLSLEDKLAKILSARYFSTAQKAACMESLLKLGVNVRTRNDVLLRWASEHGLANIVLQALCKGANIHVLKNEPLIRATYHHHADVIRILILHGADHSAKDYAAFRLSAAAGDLEIMKYLLQFPTDITARNNFALKQAFAQHHSEVVAFLVKHYSAEIKQHALNADDFVTLDILERVQSPSSALASIHTSPLSKLSAKL